MTERLLLFPSSALGNLPLNTPKKHKAAIHSATVVAIPAPRGPIPKWATSITSNSKFTALLPKSIKVGVLVSKYPLITPFDAEQSKTAGAANARTVKN